jgi:hypothetical protein
MELHRVAWYHLARRLSATRPLMSERTYYSTQTTLAYDIQAQIYQNFYLYVAVEFDPQGNHPTSNPRLIAEQWCRVATGKASDDDLERWKAHIQVLSKIAFKLESRGFISNAQATLAHDRIAINTLEDAAPMLITVAHDEGYTIQPGDRHSGYEDTEVEFVIADLKPERVFSVVRLPCP